jgi:hypothetical protein
LYVVIHYDDEDWWAPPTTVSTRLPYSKAMDEYDRLQKNGGPNDTYQVFMVDCKIIGKK